MSALPPIATLIAFFRHVRFGPEAEATRFHIVVPESGHSADMYEWHWARGIEAMRGSGRRDESGRFYVRWCFADPATKKAFAAQFKK